MEEARRARASRGGGLKGRVRGSERDDERGHEHGARDDGRLGRRGAHDEDRRLLDEGRARLVLGRHRAEPRDAGERVSLERVVATAVHREHERELALARHRGLRARGRPRRRRFPITPYLYRVVVANMILVCRGIVRPHW